ncbi:uncharacterized protein LOC132349150 isoform X2 [Balaenoptera ricei]|uniref:uncharacterized protein LOC132349150 isoform X2 n=1 Tax=Balaenoptera ricei TaxID=2746895 RepID=UPI0028BDAD63|nr:uncharacterized protein LOC132349150 isoform X2 [Balaenoptera ricei]
MAGSHLPGPRPCAEEAGRAEPLGCCARPGRAGGGALVDQTVWGVVVAPLLRFVLPFPGCRWPCSPGPGPTAVHKREASGPCGPQAVWSTLSAHAAQEVPSVGSAHRALLCAGLAPSAHLPGPPCPTGSRAASSPNPPTRLGWGGRRNDMLALRGLGKALPWAPASHVRQTQSGPHLSASLLRQKRSAEPVFCAEHTYVG